MPYHDPENLATLYPNGFAIRSQPLASVCQHTSQHPVWLAILLKQNFIRRPHSKRESAITPFHRSEKTIMRAKIVFSCNSREFSGTPQFMRFVIADRAIRDTHLTVLAYFAFTSTHALTPAPYRHILLLRF